MLLLVNEFNRLHIVTKVEEFVLWPFWDHDFGGIIQELQVLDCQYSSTYRIRGH